MLESPGQAACRRRPAGRCIYYECMPCIVAAVMIMTYALDLYIANVNSGRIRIVFGGTRMRTIAHVHMYNNVNDHFFLLS